jgi:multidrug resistance efflux pump
MEPGTLTWLWRQPAPGFAIWNRFLVYRLEETKLNSVRVGDLAMVTPLSGASPIRGEVDSIARGIGDTQNPTGNNLLQNVNATFEWVRLAQRIPVRIKLLDVPKDTILSSGMTVTVSIMQDTNLRKDRSAACQ